MAVGERCPACGHMPGEEIRPGPLTAVDVYEPWSQTREGQLVALAVDLTRATTTLGASGEEVAVKLATIHGALMGLTFAKTPDDPPA